MRHVVLAVLLALPLLAPTGAAADYHAGRYALTVDGETALGYVAYPLDAPPTTLLVFGHGCCGKPDQTGFVEAYARAYHAAVVAMDYRGPGGWDVWKGHEDLLAATVDLQARFPIERTIIWGISMGGETTGLAVAARPELYDYWVDTFGVVNLVEEFAALGHYPGVSANPANPSNPTSSAIVRETGGTPATHLGEYEKRSPVLMSEKMRGIQRAYIFHGAGDLIVPYTMSREMFENLGRAGVPATLWTYTTGWGGVQGAWGTANVPGCVAGQCTPPPCVATPTGTACAPMPGLAAHDGRGAGHSYWVVDQLMRGSEPDGGAGSVEHVNDHTAGQRVDAPRR